jgi:hypothetical protein
LKDHPAKSGGEKLPSPRVIARRLKPKASWRACPADGGRKVYEDRLDGCVRNLSLPRLCGVLNYETAISDCPDRTYVLKGSCAVLHRESKVF